MQETTIYFDARGRETSRETFEVPDPAPEPLTVTNAAGESWHLTVDSEGHLVTTEAG